MPHPLRILVIDDNPVDRVRIIHTLEESFPQLQVRQAATEAEVSDAVEAGDFDLVLTDYLLPWTDGLALFRRIRAVLPEIPVLMVTGSGNEEIAIEAIKAGLDDYIMKSSRHLGRLPSAVQSVMERVEQRRRLKEVEARYRTLFDRAPVGLYRVKANGEFVEVNPALVDMLGYPSREGLMAINAVELYVNRDDHQQWQTRVERDGVVHQFEAPFRRRDGAIAWLRNSARSVRDPNGRMLFYEGSLEDISDRRRAEDAMTKWSHQLDALRAATSEITRELDLRTLLTRIAHSAAELVEGAWGGVYLWDAATELLAPRAWWGYAEPVPTESWRLGEGVVGGAAAQRRGMVENRASSATSGGRVSEHDANWSAVIAEPLLYRERLLGVTVIGMRNQGLRRQFSEGDRHILRLFAAQAAVTIENARLFGEVSQAKREWENTFDAAADMIAVLDLECRILRVNLALARRLQADSHAILGRRFSEVFEACEGATPGSAFARCIESRQAVTEEREVTRTGEVFLQTYSPFLDWTGNPVGVVQVCKDVTVQRRLQRQLSHSEKMVAMGQLISGVAHELNNPLTAIVGNAQLIILTPGDEIGRRRAEEILTEAERAAKIVRNLLAFARPYKAERQRLRLDDLIDEVLSLRSADLNLQGIAVIRSSEGEVPPILADPQQIRQVLFNLFLNAIQALSGKTGGEILIATSVDAPRRWVTVTVADNGPGIPADTLSRIFDPFFTTKEVGQGTGLGLAMCYGIVREHGGRIRARNRPEGGACLECDLPVSGDGASAPAAAPTAPKRAKRILVADDEEAIRRIAGDALRMLGHQVDTAGDGQAALEKLTHDDYDVVLMDMKMPGFEGSQIYEDVIRPKAIRPRVVIMTGDPASADTRAFLTRTGLRCVEKPFKLEDIWDCVRDVDESSQ